MMELFHVLGDICAELSRHASKLFLATKHGSYTLNRIVFSGYPYDARVLTRASQHIPLKLKNAATRYLCNRTVDHSNVGLEPLPVGSCEHSLIPIINDEIGQRISTGHIVVKPEITSVKGNCVIFADGSVADDISSIILCTGYKRHFSFLEEENVFSFGKDGKSIPLYKYIIPVEHTGKIAFIGTTAVQGSVFPTYEMQARYAVEVFLGTIQLPTENEMRQSIQEQREQTKAMYGSELREQMRV